METSKDFTGRYIKVLNDSGKGHYNGLKNGMYLKFHSKNDFTEFWGASDSRAGIPYYFGGDVHANKDFQLMPEGFKPWSRPEYVKCISGKSDSYITGTIYPVEKDGRVQREPTSNGARSLWDNTDSERSEFEFSTPEDYHAQQFDLKTDNALKNSRYVECIAEKNPLLYSGAILGKIYEVERYASSHFFLKGETKGNVSIDRFEIATKDAFDLQRSLENSQKIQIDMEGTYKNLKEGQLVYITKSNAYLHPVGSIRRIVYVENQNYVGNLTMKVTGIPSVNGDIQWIKDARELTLKEAIEYDGSSIICDDNSSQIKTYRFYDNLRQSNIVNTKDLNKGTGSNINRKSTSELIQKLKRKTV